MRMPRWFGRPDFGAEEVDERAQLQWAGAGAVLLILVCVAVSVLYLRPPGTSTYHLELPESGGLAAGDEVRIAGVPVGSVTALELADHHVDVTFTVDSKHHIGDRTSVSVRMLTPVGGLYLALRPEGERPLTDSIPPERATLPFLVNDLFEQADAVVEQLDTHALRTALDKTSAALSESPEAIDTTVTDLEAVIGVLAQQKTQIEDLLALSNEYLRTANDNKDLAVEIIRGYAVLGPQIIAAHEDVKVFADGLAGLSGLLFDFLSGPYAAKIEPLLPPLEEAADQGAQLQSSVEAMMNSMTDSLNGLAALAGPEGQALIDQSGLTVARPEVCLPMPGIRC